MSRPTDPLKYTLPRQDYFVTEKTPSVKETLGEVREKDGAYLLSAAADEVALADFGMREPSMLLECTVSLGEEGYEPVSFGSDLRPILPHRYRCPSNSAVFAA